MNAERSAPVREHIDHRPEGLHNAALRAKLGGGGVFNGLACRLRRRALRVCHIFSEREPGVRCRLC